MKEARGTRIIVAAAAIFLISTGPAAAYLDPGTGSMIVQGLVGAVVGGLVAIRIFWQRVKLLFRPSADRTDRNLVVSEKRSGERRSS